MCLFFVNCNKTLENKLGKEGEKALNSRHIICVDFLSFVILITEQMKMQGLDYLLTVFTVHIPIYYIKIT